MLEMMLTTKRTTEIVLNNHTIAMEDLNVKGMVKNHKLARRLNDRLLESLNV